MLSNVLYQIGMFVHVIVCEDYYIIVDNYTSLIIFLGIDICYIHDECCILSKTNIMDICNL